MSLYRVDRIVDGAVRMVERGQWSVVIVGLGPASRLLPRGRLPVSHGSLHRNLQDFRDLDRIYHTPIIVEMT